MALVILAACRGDGVTSSDIFGTYTLSTINGASLPFSVTATEQILSDQMVIASGVGWTENGTVSLTQAGQTNTQAFSDEGTVNLLGGTSISLFSTDNDQLAYSGDFGKTSLTIVSAGFTFVFTK